MNKIIITAVVIVSLIGGMYLFKNTQAKSVVASTNQKVVTQEKFDFKNAYEIFPGPITAESKTAMAGFAIKSTLNTDGSTLIELSSTNPEYKNQRYTVKPGQKLYFIEKFAGEDSEKENTDTGLRDDSAIVVDVDGFVVSQ